MGDVGNAIKYLYSQFILRDVLSFVTPGAIVVLTAFSLFLPDCSLSQRLDTLFRYSRDMHWLLYIPLFGVFYFGGYAVQCIIKLVSGEYCTEKTEQWKKDREKTIDFLNATANAEWARQYWERVVVHKQMYLNNFGAVVIAVIFLLVDGFVPWQSASILVVSITVFLFGVPGWFDDRDSERALNSIRCKIIRLAKEGKLKEDKS